LFAVFFLIWIMLNGKLTVEIALIGLMISVALYLLVCYFMGYSLKSDLKAVRQAGFSLRYVAVLLREIFKANVSVIRIVLSPGFEIRPVLFYFKTNLKTDSARTALANSITLTPGTITVSLEKDELCVHCLDASFVEGVDHGTFTQFLAEWEKKAGAI